jgi:hypothetical protein
LDFLVRIDVGHESPMVGSQEARRWNFGVGVEQGAVASEGANDRQSPCPRAGLALLRQSRPTDYEVDGNGTSMAGLIRPAGEVEQLAPLNPKFKPEMTAIGQIFLDS